jgi:hypothetical protein
MGREAEDVDFAGVCIRTVPYVRACVCAPDVRACVCVCVCVCVCERFSQLFRSRHGLLYFGGLE